MRSDRDSVAFAEVLVTRTALEMSRRFANAPNAANPSHGPLTYRLRVAGRNIGTSAFRLFARPVHVDGTLGTDVIWARCGPPVVTHNAGLVGNRPLLQQPVENEADASMLEAAGSFHCGNGALPPCSVL